MSFANRLQYYRRIFRAYLVPGRSQLTFWHETPQANPNAITDKLGEYYMGFEAKADYSGHYDSHGIPRDSHVRLHGQIGLQYNRSLLHSGDWETTTCFTALVATSAKNNF
jgi:hypothetical protein